jgi:cysteinyl-tRNA synthetase
MTLSESRSLAAGAPDVRRPRPEAPAAVTAPEAASTPATATLRDIVLDRERSFDSAVARGDAEAMARAVLDIDTAVVQWAADTEEDMGVDWARDVLRSLVVRLGQAAARGLRDPHDALAPAVEPLLAVRAELRRSRLYRLADSIRDALTAAGVETRDTPQGTLWRYTEHSGTTPGTTAPVAAPETSTPSPKA